MKQRNNDIPNDNISLEVKEISSPYVNEKVTLSKDGTIDESKKVFINDIIYNSGGGGDDEYSVTNDDVESSSPDWSSNDENDKVDEDFNSGNVINVSKVDELSNTIKEEKNQEDELVVLLKKRMDDVVKEHRKVIAEKNKVNDNKKETEDTEERDTDGRLKELISRKR